jgi:predicted ribosome quality control (RQC) complex YloA/Tae2 family protein
MLSNYYTLRWQAADLNSLLRGCPLEEAFCQSKNELFLNFRLEDEPRTLVVSCEPSMNYLFLRRGVNRAKKNSVDVFRVLWGRIIREVIIQPSDRELVFKCSGDVRLLVRMFGSKANVLLVDEHDAILDSFLNPRENRGKKIVAEDTHARQTPRDTVDVQSQLRSIGSIVLPAAIKKIFPLFNTLLIREVCFRAKVSEHQVVAELSGDDVKCLVEASETLAVELERSCSARIYSRGDAAPTLSTVPLQHLQGASVETFDSIHDAVRTLVGSSRRQKSLLQEKEVLLHFLRQGAEKAERTLQKMEKETEALERATRYELFGKLLMANLGQLHKGMAEVEIEDVYSHERSLVTIRLDQKLTPARNAEFYFDKSKKARAGIGEKIEHQEEVRERWELLRDLHDNVTDLHTYDQLAEFTAAHREQLKRLGFKGIAGERGERREEVPFRQFIVTGGFQVWVGKSSENNDLLTLKYAKPSDLWFHARGSSGSHVILRAGTGKGEPSKRALEETASIAAFYSKMKTAKHVPVAMTERKYVRKPRGATAGTVTIEREKLLFVNPRLPEGTDDTER